MYMPHPQFAYTDEWVKLMAEYLVEMILAWDAEKYKNSDIYIPVIFLAGAPWAGKTEWIESFPVIEHYITLDTDLYRSLFEGYTGTNASEYHQYASRAMDRMYSFCIKWGYNMIVDGTFSNLQKAHENIRQCEKKWLAYSIVFVMQDPLISYLYTKKREQEGIRNVPTETFIEKYYKSIDVVRLIYERYPNTLIFITKKLKSNPKYSDIQVKHGEQFDRLTKYEYTRENLSWLLLQLDRNCEKNPWFLTKLIWALQKNN